MIIIVGSDKLRIERITADFEARFSVDEKGTVDYILDMKVVRDRKRRVPFFNQEQYAKDAVQRGCTDE